MEVGCGTGLVLSEIAKMKPWRRLVGAELHPTALETARKRLSGTAHLVQMDACSIPARNVFDVIGAFDVLEHIEDDERALAAMRGALRSTGGVLLTVPQHPWLWSNTDKRALHVRRYRSGELEAKLERSGFSVLFSASYTALLLPLMAASRLGSKIAPRLGCPAPKNCQQSLGVEFELPPLLNHLLRGILNMEVTLTLAGVRFPVGGSRVIVARKLSPC